MTYTPKAIAEIEDAFATLPSLESEIREAYFMHSFTNASAKEFAHHGLARRVATLLRCIENVFHIIPLSQIEPVETEPRHDAEINIHAFVIAVFGSLDNLARIWTLEKGVLNKKEQPLRDPEIGLTSGYTIVQGSLTPAMQHYLDGMAAWFEYLIGFRHSLAHRVPLYIPPYMVSDGNADRYQAIYGERFAAVMAGDNTKVAELEAEQKTLKVFRAWIVRSHNEEPRPVCFHSQMIADFRTVHAVAMRFIEDLRAP